MAMRATQSRAVANSSRLQQPRARLIVRLLVSLLLTTGVLNVLYLTRQPVENQWEGLHQLQQQGQGSIGSAAMVPGGSNELTRSLDSASLSSTIPSLSETSPAPRGTERVVQLLKQAGVTDLDAETRAALPTWDEITQLYGSSQQPMIYGMDSCARYRETVPADQRQTAVAGLFNTATNALAWSLRHNVPTAQHSKWQVPWGKHRLASVKWNHTVEGSDRVNKTAILPVVIIKDPFTWLQSMCRHPYSARWRETAEHCPNLVPNDSDRSHFPVITKNHNRTVPVKIVFSKESVVKWDSLILLWNDWYRQYMNAEYPVLMVRFEDLLFGPAVMLQHIATCVGVNVANPIRYQVESSKRHGSQTDLVHAVIKYGHSNGRLRNLTNDDLAYAVETLDDDLIRTFQYQMPSLSLKDAASAVD